MKPERRTTFEQACAGYDAAFERALVDEIANAIGLASMVTDANVLALRTGETISALATCMAATLALCEGMDVPSHLREAVDRIAKRIRRDAARARAAGVGDILGGAKAGRA
jgi:hypothetical protein